MRVIACTFRIVFLHLFSQGNVRQVKNITRHFARLVCPIPRAWCSCMHSPQERGLAVAFAPSVLVLLRTLRRTMVWHVAVPVENILQTTQSTPPHLKLQGGELDVNGQGLRVLKENGSVPPLNCFYVAKPFEAASLNDYGLRYAFGHTRDICESPERSAERGEMQDVPSGRCAPPPRPRTSRLHTC